MPDRHGCEFSSPRIPGYPGTRVYMACKIGVLLKTHYGTGAALHALPAIITIETVHWVTDNAMIGTHCGLHEIGIMREQLLLKVKAWISEIEALAAEPDPE